MQTPGNRAYTRANTIVDGPSVQACSTSTSGTMQQSIQSHLFNVCSMYTPQAALAPFSLSCVQCMLSQAALALTVCSADDMSLYCTTCILKQASILGLDMHTLMYTLTRVYIHIVQRWPPEEYATLQDCTATGSACNRLMCIIMWATGLCIC